MMVDWDWYYDDLMDAADEVEDIIYYDGTIAEWELYEIADFHCVSVYDLMEACGFY